jgi:hypothetical protein
MMYKRGEIKALKSVIYALLNCFVSDAVRNCILFVQERLIRREKICQGSDSPGRGAGQNAGPSPAYEVNQNFFLHSLVCIDKQQKVRTKVIFYRFFFLQLSVFCQCHAVVDENPE